MKKCYFCLYRGDLCKTPSGTHCHCEHPSMYKQAIKSPWGTWHFAFDECNIDKFEKRDNNDKTGYMNGLIKLAEV